MSTYSKSGIQFYYAITGEGYPLLFLHGLGGESSQSIDMLNQVKGYKRIVMDCRGHGKTEPFGPYKQFGIGPFAEDAWDLMQYLDYGQFIAGGISMGAAVALKLALSRPSSIKALILVRPAWLNEPAPKNLRSIMHLGKLLKKNSVQDALKKFQSSSEYKQYKQQYPAVASSMISQFNAEHAKERAYRLIRIPETVPYKSTDELKAIQCPSLIIATDRDPVHPLGLAQKLAELLPSSIFITVTSKSENEEKHISECSYHISDFLNQVRI